MHNAGLEMAMADAAEYSLFRERKVRDFEAARMLMNASTGRMK